MPLGQRAKSHGVDIASFSLKSTVTASMLETACEPSSSVVVAVLPISSRSSWICISFDYFVSFLVQVMKNLNFVKDDRRSCYLCCFGSRGGLLNLDDGVPSPLSTLALSPIATLRPKHCTYLTYYCLRGIYVSVGQSDVMSYPYSSYKQVSCNLFLLLLMLLPLLPHCH